MQNKVKLLIVGDVIGKGGRNALICQIKNLKEKYNYDFLIVNAENTTHGRGLSYKHYLSYKEAGVDVMTMGNHVLDEKTIANYIEKTNDLVVPGNVNYDLKVFDDHKEANLEFQGKNIRIINVLGNDTTIKVIANNQIEFFKKYADSNDILVVDYHGEYTQDKNGFAYYFDGIASCIFGTHTHVQTADERILPKGTAFITDVGMCGASESVIGFDYEDYIKRADNPEHRSGVSKRTPMMINAICVTIDLDTKKALDIIRIRELVH